MEQDDFLKELKSSLEENKIEFTEQMLIKLKEYFLLSRHWGKKINITKNLDVKSFLRENILDAAVGWKILKNEKNRENVTCVDVGCGGGYLGIIIKIIFPETEVILLDSDRKKINFCKTVLRQLQLQAECEHIRWEDWETSLDGVNPVFISRATWGPMLFFEMIKKHRKEMQSFYAAYWASQAQAADFKHILTYQVNQSDHERCIVKNCS